MRLLALARPVLLTYRFERTTGPVRYRFRLKVVRQAGLPFQKRRLARGVGVRPALQRLKPRRSWDAATSLAARGRSGGQSRGGHQRIRVHSTGDPARTGERPARALGSARGARCDARQRPQQLARAARAGRRRGGVGKTALVRRFCDEHARSARILWGACDALFTPRPLGPLLDVAEDDRRRAGAGRGGRRAGRTRSPRRCCASSRARARRSSCSRTCTGPTRPRSTSLRLLARSGHGARAGARDLPRRRARPRHPLRIVLGELASGQHVARCELRRSRPGGRGARRAARRRRGRAPPPHGGQPVLRHRGAGGGDVRSRRRCATRCSPAPRA